METKGIEIILSKRLFVRLCNHFDKLISSSISLIEKHEEEAKTDDYWKGVVKDAHEECRLANEMLGVLYKDED